jgi:hypothetical protein
MNDRAEKYFDVDELLHPASAFGHPSEVVNDPDLTLNEKRAILASWASDACAIEAAPELRSSPSGTRVRFEEIMEALRTLDKEAKATNTGTCSTNAVSPITVAIIGAVPVRRCNRQRG